MQRRRFSHEFKLEAVRLAKDRGVAVAQAARDLDIHENVLRKWIRDAKADPQHALQRSGQAEGGARHPKKGRSLLREGSDMKFVFIAKHRSIWPLAWLREALDISRSGFHAWLNRSPSVHARQDDVLATAMDRKRPLGAM